MVLENGTDRDKQAMDANEARRIAYPRMLQDGSSRGHLVAHISSRKMEGERKREEREKEKRTWKKRQISPPHRGDEFTRSKDTHSSRGTNRPDHHDRTCVDGLWLNSLMW